MASVSEPDSDEALSQSWPDTEMGLLEQPPESPPLQKRKTYSHYTQVGKPQSRRSLSKCRTTAAAVDGWCGFLRR